MQHTVHLVAGARPNFMKIAPIYHELMRVPSITPVLVHTGQHSDPAMSDAFFADLSLPDASYHLECGSGSHGVVTARVLERYEALLSETKPAFVVVVGDINSTVATALAAVKLGIAIGHVESGLRSRDRRMPEETNRVLTDHMADLLWTHSKEADANLQAEGVDAHRIVRVGNVMIDTLVRLLPEIRTTNLESQPDRPYVVATFHRPSNVDDPGKLREVLAQLRGLRSAHEVVLPLHPRTRKRIDEFGLWAEASELTLLPPLNYKSFLCLVAGADAVITDSGGIQEETSYLRIPCLTVRETTERWVTVNAGTNRLIAAAGLSAAMAEVSRGSWSKGSEIPLWDGHAAERIVASLVEFLEQPI